MIFFFDECVPEAAARLIGVFDLDHEVRHAVDRFDRGTPDTEWMPKVASWDGDPVAVCADGRILKNKAERQVLKECKLMFVYLAPVWTHTPWHDYAWKLVKVWPQVVQSVEESPYPLILRISGRPNIETIGRVDTL